MVNIFENMDLNLVLLPVIIFWVFVSVLSRKFMWKSTDVRTRALRLLRLEMIMLGVFMAILWLSLPFVPGLYSFGYPDSVRQIERPEEILHYLQEYNRAIVRTTQVLLLTLISFIVLLGSFYRYFKVVGPKENDR